MAGPLETLQLVFPIRMFVRLGGEVGDGGLGLSEREVGRRLLHMNGGELPRLKWY